MLKTYCNQTLTRKVYGGVDLNNEELFIQKTIRCRFEKRFQRILMTGGRELISSARMYSIERVYVRDRIVYESADYEVIEVSEMVNFEGKTVGYESLFGNALRSG